MSYATEQAAMVRTPQAILTVGVKYCQNWYATLVDQVFNFTEDLSFVVYWNRAAGTTVTTNTTIAPDGKQTADTVAFAAVNDYIQTLLADGTAASQAYTGSIWLRTVSGTGTITLYARDEGATEEVSAQVSLTTTWQRFALHKLFTAGAAGAFRLRLERETGDLASVVAWGANGTRNPAAADREILFPYIRRELATIDNTVRASRCAAADAGDGSRCYYTAPTCQDFAHFNSGNAYEATPALRGIREYKFCLQKQPLPFKGGTRISPALESYDQAAQEIDAIRAAKGDQKGGITKNERSTYRLIDDAGPGVWDLGKQSDGAKVNTARGAGTFWRRFLAIHKNYDNPEGYAKLATGYVGDVITEADYKPRLKGPILNVKLDGRGRVTVQASDSLQNLKRKVPTKLSSTNTLAQACGAADGTIYIEDASELLEPAPNAAVAETYDADGNPLTGPDYKIVLLLGGVEKVNVITRDVTTGACTVDRGRWGTTAVAHLAHVTVQALIEFGTEQTTPANPVLAKNPINCLVELLKLGAIAAADINTTQLYDQRDTWLRSEIDPTNGTQSGALFRRTISDPIELNKLLAELCEDALLFAWQDEDQKVTGKVFAPITPAETVVELTDASSFIAETVDVEDDNEARLSRVVYGWDLSPGAAGDQLTDYLQQQARVLSDEESAGFYGAQKDKIIKSKWLSGLDVGTAGAVAARLLNRFRQGARVLSASLEAKDDDNVKLGSFVRVTTAWLQTPDGSTDSGRIMQVVRKEQVDLETGRMRIRCLDTALFGRFAFWGASTLPDYDVATAADMLFGYWADSNGKVGANFDPPYRWW